MLLAVLPSCATQPAGLLDITPSFKFNKRGRDCLPAYLRGAGSTDGQSAFASAPAICEQTVPVTTTQNGSEHPKRMAEFVLYQRDYCHLCDQALAVLAQARAPDFDSVWVDDSQELQDRYGTRVPVLRDSRDGREFDWPFDEMAVRDFFAQG